MTADEGTRRIISALESAVVEHGWPNSFSAGSLNQEYTKLSPMTIGKWAVRVVNELRLRGWDIRYIAGIFFVDQCPQYPEAEYK